MKSRTKETTKSWLESRSDFTVPGSISNASYSLAVAWATVGRQRYVLYGFRSGDSLCLRLLAITLRSSLQPVCAPVSALEELAPPLLVVDEAASRSRGNRSTSSPSEQRAIWP